MKPKPRRKGRNRIDQGWPTEPQYGPWRECTSHPDVDICDEHEFFKVLPPSRKGRGK